MTETTISRPEVHYTLVEGTADVEEEDNSNSNNNEQGTPETTKKDGDAENGKVLEMQLVDNMLDTKINNGRLYLYIAASAGQ